MWKLVSVPEFPRVDLAADLELMTPETGNFRALG